MAPQPRIFISYARKDAVQLAQRLQGDLRAKGFDAWLDTQRLFSSTIWTTEIEQAIDTSHIVLALMTPGSYVSEICRAEQLRSLRKGKRIIPLLARTGSEIPLHLEAKQYRDFTGAKAYAAQFRLLLQDIRLGRSGVPLRPELRTTYVTAPPLPRNYLERTAELVSLRNALIGEGGGPSIALTALEGMGGIGKTILAQALCHDEVTQQAFPDGVIWIDVGKGSTYDLRTRMREVGKVFSDDLAGYDTDLGCINRYRTLMRDKAALIVVDDIWRSADLEPFRAESPRSRLLFTTRDTSIAAAVGAKEHVADLLTVEQSRELLARWCGVRPVDLLSEASGVIKESGRLPLAVAMIGAMLRGKPLVYWKHVRNLLHSADLARIKAQFPDYPHTDLLRAIQVSVDALDDKVRERYLALAVLLEDMPIHPAILQTVWGSDEAEALESAEQLVSLSLAQRVQDQGSGALGEAVRSDGAGQEAAQRGGDGCSIRLHDLQFDYVRAQYPDREALDLIHGAVRLSAHVIGRDPWQFASQVVGRLLLCAQQEGPVFNARPKLQQFTKSIARGAPRPWLRPRSANLTPPGGPLIRTLSGHTGGVNAVAATPDGKRAISASYDHTLKIWDLASGHEVRTLSGHTGPVNAVSVTPDGKQAVSASGDQTLKVWDLASGHEVRTLSGHIGVIVAVTVTPDGRQAVSASGDQTLKVWDLASGQEVRTLSGHTNEVRAVAVTPDGKQAVSASGDQTLKVWDLASGQEVRTLSARAGGVLAVAVTPDGKHAVFASMDETLKVWDLMSGQEVRTLDGHTGFVDAVAVTPDGRQAVSASYDQTLKVWDLASGREVRNLGGHADKVHGVAVTPDGERAISASWDRTLKVWDLASDRKVHTLNCHTGRIWAVAATPDGKQAVSASRDNTLKVWDLASGQEVRTLSGHTDEVRAVAVTPDGKQAVSASYDQTLKVWDLASGQAVRTLNGHIGRVRAFAVTPDGKEVVSAPSGQTLKVRDLASGREVRTLSGHTEQVNAVAVMPDGKHAASASSDQTLKVWDLASGQEVRTLSGHTDWVLAVAVTPDGKQAVSASRDNTLKVWDLASGHEVRTLSGHSGWVLAVAVLPDGKQAVSASFDKTLKVWDLVTGVAVAAFTCDAAAYCCACGDERTIVAGDTSGRVHFLSIELPAPPREH